MVDAPPQIHRVHLVHHQERLAVVEWHHPVRVQIVLAGVAQHADWRQAQPRQVAAHFVPQRVGQHQRFDLRVGDEPAQYLGRGLAEGGLQWSGMGVEQVIGAGSDGVVLGVWEVSCHRFRVGWVPGQHGLQRDSV